MMQQVMQRQAAPLREQVVAKLRALIVRGDFPGGHRLKERELVEEFSVSRTVIREALRQLESERLVRIEPHVGPRVQELTPTDARQLYEVRAALEGAAARLAAIHRTEQQLKELHEALVFVSKHFDTFDDLIGAKERFYRALIIASRNEIIGEQLAGIQARISQLRRVTLSQPNRGKRMVTELQRVVNAIAAQDKETAYQASIEHVEAAAEIALAHLNTPTEA